MYIVITNIAFLFAALLVVIHCLGISKKRAAVVLRKNNQPISKNSQKDAWK